MTWCVQVTISEDQVKKSRDLVSFYRVQSEIWRELFALHEISHSTVGPRAGGGNRPLSSGSGQMRVVGQLVLEHGGLSVHHAADVQFTAARKGKVFRRIRKQFRMLGRFERCHEHK